MTKDTDEGYGISYLAEQLDMEPSNVRNALRRLNVEKTDNRYSWSRKSEADAVVKRIKDAQKANTGTKAKADTDAPKGKGKAGAKDDAKAKAKGKAGPPTKGKGKAEAPAKGKKGPPKKASKDEDGDDDEE